RRQGSWQESLEAFERASTFDPQNPNIVRNILFTNTAMRRWPEAAVAAARFRALAPDSVVGKIQSGYVEFMWKGDTATLRNVLGQIPPPVDPDGSVTSVRWDSAMLERDFARGAQVLAQSSLRELAYMAGGLQPKSFLAGMTALAQNDRATAEANFTEALPHF